jgi:hypothetical protein
MIMAAEDIAMPPLFLVYTIGELGYDQQAASHYSYRASSF